MLLVVTGRHRQTKSRDSFWRVETRDNPAKFEMIIIKNLVGSQDFDGLRSEEQRPWPGNHPISLQLGLLKKLFGLS